MRPIRVLHLFNQYLPQTENWAYHLISNLNNAEVYVAARHYLKQNFFAPEFTFFDHPFGELKFRYGSWDSEDNISERLKKGLYKVLRRPLEAIFHSDLRAFTRTNQIDIIHAHFADVAWYYQSLPQSGNLPYIISFYGWDYQMLQNIHPKFKKRIENLFEWATAFVCEGEHGARLLREKGCPFEKIHIVPLGVDVQSIPWFERTKSPGQLRLLQVASFTEKKGQIYTLQAFEKALQNCPNIHLTLVGGESQKGLRSSIQNRIVEKKLSHKISLLQQIDFSDLHNFLKDFDVFIHPSCHAENGDCEGGAPIVLLDAQATGMPVITTSHCDIPTEVIDQETGIVVPEKNVERLAASIYEFCQMSNDQYERYCRRARAHVMEVFDIRQNARQLSEVYDKVLEGLQT